MKGLSIIVVWGQGRNSNTGHWIPGPGCDHKACCLLKSLLKLWDLLVFPGLAFPNSTYFCFQSLDLVAGEHSLCLMWRKMCWVAVPFSPGNWIEMQNFRPYSRPAESETLGVEVAVIWILTCMSLMYTEIWEHCPGVMIRGRLRGWSLLGLLSNVLESDVCRKQRSRKMCVYLGLSCHPTSGFLHNPYLTGNRKWKGKVWEIFFV